MLKKPRSKIEKALHEANSLMRSMHSIASREGKETNWPPFIRALEKQLQVQHEIMYPDRYLIKK